MTIPKRIPSVGEVLVHKFRGNKGQIEATVLSVNDGGNQITVTVRGKKYSSLSLAAKSVTGNPQNGWTYWGLKKQVPYKRNQ